ncbi:ABC transporter ATP-binding protein [Pseudooceanicola sediminis]|uniref:ABC transporter ATP-binding protein n=1 Tax=Pseudooceanicola sediminis TaxID=2211117 RepID=A0A399JCC8_9RHOB|nr:ABC transporter ATP-binding protein [Pseudooceanicola sediminis]KAA2315508.1 ABC transporter ATP-binding protein [Puniceibacterium sp. HSS470]RII40286.1 ABC transporter ATP-binding protein [Pseudooceanicola sediminis]|tara:strand:- start:88885 stop:90651 length:1767 start_codon:yes stop_codon:yes gene_type:complete
MLAKLLPGIEEKLLYRLLSENYQAQAKWYALAILSMFFVAGTTAASAWIMKDIVQSLSPDEPAYKVYGVAMAVAAIFAVKGIAGYLQAVFLSIAGNRIIASQQIKMFDRLIQQGVSYFGSKSSSDTLVSLTQASQAARAVLDTVLLSFVRDLFTLIGLGFVMFTQQPVLSAVSIVTIPVALFGIKNLLKKVRDIVTREMVSLSAIIKVATETSMGIRVIKAFALEDHMAARMNQAVTRVEKMSNSIARLQAATMPMMDVLSGLAIAAILAMSATTIFGGRVVTSQGQLLSFLTALIMAYDPARRLASMRIGIETGLVGVKMMYDLLDHPITMLESENAKPLPEGPRQVAFRNVSFNYEGGNGETVLKSLDLEFAAGKSTALVGPSGSGKSTILNLTMRLYDPTDGQVEIDGMDIRDVTFASLRENMAFVGQDTFLFAGSVKHNIGLGRADATDDEIIAAAKAANAHDFISKLPEGYESDVGENGGNLSGGQRQRLSIARAILRDAPILLLDEATSALDAESEAEIQKALHDLSQGRTTILIAHRLSSVMRADQIIVVKDGEILEQGTPAELLKNENFFKRSYDLQYDM